MKILKVGALGLLVTASKLVSGVLLNKIIAVTAGPIGLVFIGQFNSFMQIVSTISQAGTTEAITKYTSQYRNDNELVKSFISASIKVTFTAATLSMIIVFAYANYISNFLFSDGSYAKAIYVFGLSIYLMVLNQLMLAILNGLKDVVTWAKISVIQNIVLLTSTSILTMMFDLQGIVYSLAITQIIYFFIIYFIVRDHEALRLFTFKFDLSKDIYRKIFKFSAMILCSAILAPFTHIIVRYLLNEQLGAVATGNWQAMIYLSNVTITIFSSIIPIYILPRISEIKCSIILKKELINVFLIIIPSVVAISFLMYVFRREVVTYLFSSEFSRMEEIFLFFMMGNVIKIVAWLFGYILIAKAMSREFIYLELIGNVGFIILNYTFLYKFGFVGLGYAYCLNFLLYSVLTLIVLKRTIFAH